MKHSSGLYLENSDMIDGLQDKQYTFTSATNEHSTRNEQRTSRYIGSDWSYLLLQEQQAQQVQQQQKQQLRLDMQQEHEDFTELLHKDPGFLRGTDRPLMKSLLQTEALIDPFLWESFPTPSTVPTRRAFELDGTELIARPLKALLDTEHIHNRIWNTSAYQMIPMLDNPNRAPINMVEVAFILNNLNFTR
ncbi:hypothetical protein MBLNU13_g01209t2 [Cladosporium sp. NU13]